ncbi:hypothetical protein [Flavivirga jejuensis]|uniref:Endosialidase-like protein n=1 Tax=Flavivirga jejuensis TaxID=870487 RepID=A0ABT8WK30_9FLAO|nr:hypothetical protein [Flavivirga jejuensis]MDO5973517.1 hypothetical protein [Flavivirga jejuensis]
METKQKITRSKNYALILLLIGFTLTVKAQVIDANATNSEIFTIDNDRDNDYSLLRMQNNNTASGHGYWELIGDPSSFVFRLQTDIGFQDVVRMHKSYGGRVGIGLTDLHPERGLHIRGSDGVIRVDRNNGSAGLMLTRMNTDYSQVLKNYFIGVNGSDENSGEFFIGDYGTNVRGASEVRLLIDNDGIVQISEGLTVGTNEAIPGTIAHFDGRVYISENDGTHEGFDDHTDNRYLDYLLWVEEGIVSNDFAIADLEDWPDYVFGEGYNLPSLEEVENNIKKTGHLHTMPSAEVVEKNGFEVSDMTKRMVKTIEELTLYTINQEKQIINQEKQIEMLMARLEALEIKLK